MTGTTGDERRVASAPERHGPLSIEVRGARHNTLAGLDVDIPLGCFTALTGRSGSGKSSLAMGVLYAEGARRYLEGLSSYTRRRLASQPRAQVDRLDHVPAALALGQRPPVPGPRSTLGTMSGVLSAIRLVFSRLGSHVCPNGHRLPPSYRSALSPHATCPQCDVAFELPSAEDFSFNGAGACPTCDGLGEAAEVDDSTLVPDPDLTLDQGAVAPWRGLMRSQMPTVAAELGVRTDVPWHALTPQEQQIVLHGEPTHRQIIVVTKGGRAVQLNAEYVNAHDSVAQIRAEGTGARADVFLRVQTCPSCQGSRYSARALSSTVAGRTLAQVSALTLSELSQMVTGLTAPGSGDPEPPPFAADLVAETRRTLDPLIDLGLEYLTLDRSGATLSTGERQRVGLADTLHASATGLLYVLDEPTIGLHPDNVAALVDVFGALVRGGNTVVVVDHDVTVLAAADCLVELGPGAGPAGGHLVAQGTPAEVAADPASLIGGFLSAPAPQRIRPVLPPAPPLLRLHVDQVRNLREVEVTVPRGRLTVVVGASGAGKSALVLEALAPALTALQDGEPLPPGIALEAPEVQRTVTVDAATIGKNSRSTVATWTGLLDVLRTRFADTEQARALGWGRSHFSHNTSQGRCEVCRGIGEIDLDLQYLPDVTVPCPTCHGSRYRAGLDQVLWRGSSIAEVMGMGVDHALAAFGDDPALGPVLQSVADVGLGYLKLGESTPALSGGEAQRLRLASRLRSRQHGTLFILDEPSIGLHPLDVQALLGVFDRLIASGGTVLVVDHDLDIAVNADHLVELGPGAGVHGGRVVAAGSVEQVMAAEQSRMGPWLAGRGRPQRG